MLSLFCCLFGVALAVPIQNDVLQTVPKTIIEPCHDSNSSGTLEGIQMNAHCDDIACHVKGGQRANIQIMFQVGKNSTEVLSEIDVRFHFNSSFMEGDWLDGKLELACENIKAENTNTSCPLVSGTTYTLTQKARIPDLKKLHADHENGTISVEIATDDDGIDTIVCFNFPYIVHKVLE